MRGEGREREREGEGDREGGRGKEGLGLGEGRVQYKYTPNPATLLHAGFPGAESKRPAPRCSSPEKKDIVVDVYSLIHSTNIYQEPLVAWHCSIC